MSHHLTITAPGVPFSSRIIAITGDRLIHPHDVPSDIARIVLRWGPRWLPQTGTARQYFAARGFTDDEPCYRDRDVTGWLFLPPEFGSLAAQVRSGSLDIATALSAEALAWPSKETASDLEATAAAV